MNINFDLINLTKDTFQQYFDTAMTDEQAEDIQNRLISYFEMLIEWAKQEEVEKMMEEENGKTT